MQDNENEIENEGKSEELAETEEKEEETPTAMIQGDRHKLNDWDVVPGCLGVELPCGYIKGDQVYYQILVKEMTGREEDIFASAGPSLPKINKVLANCIVSVGGLDSRSDISAAVQSFSAYDRLVSLVAIRRVSLGDIYSPMVKCPNKECMHEQSYALDLKDLEIVPMPDRMQRNYESVLLSGTSPVTVKWHVMSARDEEWLSGTKKRRKGNILTLGFLSRVDELNGVELKRGNSRGELAAIALLEALSIKQRGELRKIFSEHEGDVKTEVEFECPECGYVWNADMGIGQHSSFFFPSE